MPCYRIYFMDGDTGHIQRLHEFQARNDHFALPQAEQLRSRLAMELWMDSRRIRRWEAPGSKPDVR